MDVRPLTLEAAAPAMSHIILAVSWKRIRGPCFLPGHY